MYLQNVTLDKYLYTGTKQGNNVQSAFKRALEIGWTLDQEWRIVFDEDYNFDDTKEVLH